QVKASLSAPTETALHSCSFSSAITTDVLSGRFALTEEKPLKVQTIVLQLPHKRVDSEDLNEEGVQCNLQLEYSESSSNKNYAKAM
ncbi:Serine/threonine-protein kinase smg1, partial [Sarracenia purpurea var. burkii]